MSELISRKEFLVKTISGIIGIGLISEVMEAEDISEIVFRKLGKTGILLSPLCFGAAGTNDEALIRYAVDKGINYIDTGRSYGNGNNEKLVGIALSGKRKDVVIQSKIRLDITEMTSNGKGKKGAEEIRYSLESKLEASLKALNTNYIDIMLYHDASEENILFHPETMKYFDEIKKNGIIRAHGFSTQNDHMELLSRNNSEGFYDVIMVPFNHKGAFVHPVTGTNSGWDQEKLISILVEAWMKGTGIIAMKTCSGGPYAAIPGAAPSYLEAVNWVLSKDFISSAAITMASFEQVNEFITLLRK